VAKPFILPSKKAGKRGNPNWGKPMEPAPAVPTAFEEQVQRLGLTVSDCSSGCKWYHPMSGDASRDWGVCGNPASHRAGLLTFEHQGCPEFEQE
jgi:hypothetical protein